MQKLVDILPNLVTSLGIDKKYKTQLIFFHWAKIVGADIAVQSSPIDVSYGVLTVAVKNSVWCHHLLMMKADLLYKIHEFIGEPLLRDIKFTNQKFPEQSNQEKENEDDENNLTGHANEVVLNKEEREKIALMCDKVQDDKLKYRLRRLYEKHLRLEKVKLNYDWHRCQLCGTLCSKDELYCKVCMINKKKEKISLIRNELLNVPWVTYAQIYQYIPCTAQEYIDAKVTLLTYFDSCVEKDDTSSLAARTLVMLFAGVSPENLNEPFIKKTLANFRRRNNVFTSRR